MRSAIRRARGTRWTCGIIQRRTAMSRDPSDVRAVALLAEFSEVRAYTSLLQAAPQQYRDTYGLRTETIGSAIAVVAESLPGSLNVNRVIGLGVAEPATEAMLDRIADLYAERGLPFGIEIGPLVTPPDIPTWLRRRGMRPIFPTTLHHRAARALELAATTLSIVQAGRGERKTVADICCAVFRMAEPVHALLEGTGDVPDWRQWLAYDRGRPIAAALSFVHGDVAWLGWDATLPEFRGRGAQSALIVHRVNDAVRAGCRHATSETAVDDPSRRNYERLGFSRVYDRSTYVSSRGSRPTASHTIQPST